MDRKANKLFKHTIETPNSWSGPWLGMTTKNDKNDDLLTFGYVNRCYKMPDFKGVQVLPFYLIKLIKEWVCFETLHLLQLNKDWSWTDWTIDVDIILRPVFQ